MVRYNKQGCPARKIALQLRPDLSDSLVCLLDCSIGPGRSRTFRVLHVVHFIEVQQRQVWAQFMQDHFENLRVSNVEWDRWLATCVRASKGNAGASAGRDEGRGRMAQSRLPRRHIWNGPVQSFGVAAGRPANRRGLQAVLLCQIVDRRDLDDLFLVVNRIGDKPDSLARLAVEIIVSQHAVARGIHAGHQCRVVRPGHGRRGGFHPARLGACVGELSYCRHLRLRIIQIKAG